MARIDHDDGDAYDAPNPPQMEVESERNPIVGELLGPDGGTVSLFFERPVTRVGVSRVPKRSSRVMRLRDFG